MSLEGHTEAVWCVKMMVDQGLMLTGFSLPFSVENCYEVLQNAQIETCKCSDEVFNDAFYFQQKQFDEIQSWEQNTNNYPLFLIFFGFFWRFPLIT